MNPSALRASSPIAISTDGQIIDQNRKNSTTLYLSNSIFVRDMYMNGLKSSFEKYRNQWVSETIFLSDPSRMFRNDAYRSVIYLGADVMPILISDMQETGNHWFYALEEISGENPIAEANRGNVHLMINDWLDWGIAKGIVN